VGTTESRITTNPPIQKSAVVPSEAEEPAFALAFAVLSIIPLQGNLLLLF
jgi:hypothetical protein